MNKNITIETERLILRQWNMNDIDDMVEGLNNINVTKWLAGAPFPYTAEDAKYFIQNTIDKDLYNFADGNFESNSYLYFRKVAITSISLLVRL